MRYLFALVVLSMGGCSGIGEPTASRVAPDGANRALGVIAGMQSDDPDVELRAQGRTVQMTVTTYGNGCYVAADMDIKVTAMDAVVSPYDWNPRCPQRDLKAVVHTARIQIPNAGTARIRIRGIDASTRSSLNLTGDTVTMLRTISIQ